MKEILADVERWQARGERFALATVVATRRSAPRPIGSKLAVSEGGEMAGSVSGGCVENDVYEHAKEVLAGAPPRVLTYGISDEMALSVGLPCGGEIDVFVEAADPALVAEIRGLLDRDQRAVLFTVVEGDAVGSRTLSTDEGDALRPRPKSPARGRARQGLRRRLRPAAAPARLWRGRHGGGALPPGPTARLAHDRGRRAREVSPPGSAVPSADRVIVAWPEEALAQVQPGGATPPSSSSPTTTSSISPR